MAGGQWMTENKVRPGAYINFKTTEGVGITPSDRGIVALPLSLDFGPKKEVIEVNGATDQLALLGNSQHLLINEALKRASKVFIYRLNGGTKAAQTEETLTVTAKYEGSKGNAIKVAIEKDVDDETLYYVTTYLEDQLVMEQAVKSIEDLGDNPYVEFSGSFVETAGITLIDGTDSEVTVQDYIDYFTAIQVYDWNVMALPTEDETVKATGVAFIKRLRDEEGKKVQLVVPEMTTADSEGVISVKNGVILADGTVIDKVKATAWVAGATAGASINVSNTYTAYDQGIDVDARYSHSQIVEALNQGQFIFVENNGKVVVEQDINTLVSFTADKGKIFRKNRVIRVLDGIGNEIKNIFNAYYLGKIDNNADGRNLFKAALIKYFNQLMELNAIKEFDGATDLSVEAGVEADAIRVEVAVKPVDSVEKLYMTVTL